MFFVLSKIAWSVVTPLNIIFLLLFAGWLMSFKRPVLARRLAGIGLFLLAVMGTGFLPQWCLRELESRVSREPIPENIAGIIVLAGMVDTPACRNGSIELTDQADRIVNGVELARKYPKTKLVITGGSGGLQQGKAYREADYLEKLALSLGISQDRLIVERDSKNTHEHAVNLKSRLPPGKNWVLVTSAFHMPRAMGCFKQQNIDVLPYPVDYKSKMPKPGIFSMASFLPQARNIMATENAFHEYLGLFVYKVIGYA